MASCSSSSETHSSSGSATDSSVSKESSSTNPYSMGLWRLNCEQLAEFDSSLAEKDEEIASLRDEVSRLHRSSPSDSLEAASAEGGGVWSSSRVRRGKAPPVDPFTGEDPECRLDDWLPTLSRAADWNG